MNHLRSLPSHIAALIEIWNWGQMEFNANIPLISARPTQRSFEDTM